MENTPTAQPVTKKSSLHLVVLFILPLLVTIGFSFFSQTSIVNSGIDKCTYKGWPFHTSVQESKAITNEVFQQRVTSGQIASDNGIAPTYFGTPQCSLPGGFLMYVANFAIFLVIVVLVDKGFARLRKSAKV